ncbi:helix-turn-helix domain-containing protein [Modestobacter sp. URMC 112]
MHPTAAGEHTVDPPTDETAAGQLRALVAALPAAAGWTVGDADGARFDLPPELLDVLARSAAALGAGRPVTLSCHEPVLSTQEAADLLGVSRPTLVRLLDQGVIPYDQPRRHRRVRLADLVSYQGRCHHDERDAGAADGAQQPGVTGPLP